MKATAKGGGLRAELAVFLRTKRMQVVPSLYGLGTRHNRRTPGLRREEVAELADVGPTWYTWLEQGREIRPSARVLGNIAAVLQLTDVEKQYMFELAGHEPVRPPAADDLENLPSIEGVVSEIRCPAFIRNGRYDMLAWNDPFAAVFPMDRSSELLERNFLWRLLREDWGSTEMLDFEPLAHQCVADFRMTYARRGAPPAFVALTAQLHAASLLFERWWTNYEVEHLHEICQGVKHASAGDLMFRLNHFDVVDQPGLKLVLFSPVAEDAAIAPERTEERAEAV